MGFEYKIAFRVSDPAELEVLLERLRGAFERLGQDDFTVLLEADGFYFCDHTKSDRSSCVFRRLVDEGLHHSDVVVHEL